MMRQVEAVFEHGVLRPLEPLSLPEQQRVIVTIAEIPTGENGYSRKAEQDWLSANAGQYLGQWVALQGSDLISHGSTARAVRDEARRRGVDRPLLVRIPDATDLPSAGWI